MNLFDRFMRVAKGNFNKVLNSLEAPEKIMEQAMIDMQVRNPYQIVSMHRSNTN